MVVELHQLGLGAERVPSGTVPSVEVQAGGHRGGGGRQSAVGQRGEGFGLMRERQKVEISKQRMDPRKEMTPGLGEGGDVAPEKSPLSSPWSGYTALGVGAAGRAVCSQFWRWRLLLSVPSLPYFLLFYALLALTAKL